MLMLLTALGGKILQMRKKKLSKRGVLSPVVYLWSYPQKVVLLSITARFSLRPYHFAIWLSFSNICHMSSRKLWLLQCIMGDDLHMYDLTLSKMRGGWERNTCSFRSPWVTLPLNLFFPTHFQDFVLFPSALIWTVDGTVCPAEYALYHLPCDLYVVVYVCK